MHPKILLFGAILLAAILLLGADAIGQYPTTYRYPSSCRPATPPIDVNRLADQIRQQLRAEMTETLRRQIEALESKYRVIDVEQLRARLRAEVLTQLMKEMRAAIDALPKPSCPAVHIDELAAAVVRKFPPTWFQIRYVNEETGEVRDNRVWIGVGNAKPQPYNGFTLTDHGLSPVDFP